MPACTVDEYRGPKSRIIAATKVISLLSSSVGLLTLPWMHNHLSVINNETIKLAITGSCGLLILLSPILIDRLARRYVLAMFYDKPCNHFLVIWYNTFMKQKYVSFPPEDIDHSHTSFLCRFQARNQCFILDPDLLRKTDPHAYITFMRYDFSLDLAKYKPAVPLITDGSNMCDDK